MNSKYNLQLYPCGLKAGEKLKMIRPPGSIVPDAGIVQEDDFWTVLTGSEEEPDIIWLLDDYGDKSIWNAEELFEQFEKA